MSKHSDEIRAKLSSLLAAQAAPDAVIDNDATVTRMALMKALARASVPKARSRTFNPHKAHAPQTRPSPKVGGSSIDSSHD